MKKLLLVILLHVGLSFGQVTTPNLGMTWPAHLSANGTWDSNVVGNSSIIDNVFGISTCGDSTHAVGWDASQKKLTCQVIAGTGVGSAFSVIGAGTNTVALRMGTGGSLDTTGGTINASSLLNGTWAIPGPIGNTVPSSGAFTWLNSDQIIDAASFVGTGSNRWTDKVVAAYGSAACASGCTIIVPDSIADDGSATTITLPINVNLQFPGSATFGVCRINVGGFSKIYDNSALLQLHGTNCVGVYVGVFESLQTNDNVILQDIKIDCNSQSGAIGVQLGDNSAGIAKAFVRNSSITNCLSTTSVGMLIKGGQFLRIENPSFYKNFVDLKLYDASGGGGGNSNLITNLKSVGDGTSATPVGVIVAEFQTVGMGPNYFINPSILSHDVAAMAVFGNSAIGPNSQNSVYIKGGAPEANGGGAATVTIDGKVIKQASTYVNWGKLWFDDVYVAEATIDPLLLAENTSTISIHNAFGYGNGAGHFTNTDGSSSIIVDGLESHSGSMSGTIAQSTSTGVSVNQWLVPSGNGSPSTPALAFAGEPGTGIMPFSNSLYYTAQALGAHDFYIGGIRYLEGTSAYWTGTTDNQVTSGTATTRWSNSFTAIDTIGGPFGSNQQGTFSSCETAGAPTVLATGATTTDTTANCLPANAVIDAVVYRITTAITTSANFTIGDATTAARFCGTQSTLTIGATGTCFVQADQTGAPGPRQASAAKVRITTNANPGAGAIRLIVYYHTWATPTS